MQAEYITLPKRILCDFKLTPTEKLVFSAIYSLSITAGFCWATNDYISSMLGISERSIRRAISKLTKLNLISVANMGKERYTYPASNAPPIFYNKIAKHSKRDRKDRKITKHSKKELTVKQNNAILVM